MHHRSLCLLLLLAASCLTVHAGYARGHHKRCRHHPHVGGCHSDLKNCRAKLQDTQGIDQELSALRQEVASLEVKVGESERPLREAERQEKVLANKVVCLQRKANLGEVRVEQTKEQIQEIKCALSEFDPTIQACKQAVEDLNLTRLGDNIYYFHTKTDGWLTFAEAFGFCESRGLQLVSLETAEENQLVKDWVKQILSFDLPLLCANDSYLVKNFWTSLYDFGNGNYIWGGSRITPSFLDLLPNDVDPDDALKSCGIIGQFQGPYQDQVFWNDLQCSETRRFICEMPKTCTDFLRDTFTVSTTYAPEEAQNMFEGNPLPAAIIYCYHCPEI